MTPLASRHGIWTAAVILLGGALVVAATIGPASARTGDKEAGSPSLLGNYLAGRQARAVNDGPAAAEFYGRALESDPGNPVLLAYALQAETSEGRLDKAASLAQELIKVLPRHHLGEMVLGIGAFKAGKLDDAVTHLRAARNGPIAEIIGNMALAWVHMAQGNADAALTTLDGVRAADGAMSYVRYHKGLLAEVAKRPADARQFLDRAFRDDPQSLRIALALSQHLASSGDFKQARVTIDEHVRRSSGTMHPEVKAVQDKLRKNERVGPLVDTAASGLAEALFGIGEALSGEGRTDMGASYLQLALAVKPEFPFALAALANVYEANKRYEDAIAVYDRIPKDTSLHTAIEIRKAQNLNQMERVEDAKSLLDKLAARDRTDIRPLDALGALMRAHKRHAEAVDYYTRAINLIGKAEKKHWNYFYARGTSYERMKKWAAAEADLQRALQLSPE